MIKRIMMVVVVVCGLMSMQMWATRTLVIKNKAQLKPNEYMDLFGRKLKESIVGIFLTPVETKKDALGSEYRADAGARIPIELTQDWTHNIPSEKMELKVDLQLKKIKPVIGKQYGTDRKLHDTQATANGVPLFELGDLTKTFPYTIPAGKDGDTVCLEVSESGVKECSNPPSLK